MAEKPSNLLYGVDDKPPVLSTLLLGLQHTFPMSASLIMPVVIVSGIGESLDVVRSVVSYTMIAAGLTTILQALKKGPIGSGYLCPHVYGPSYLAASIQAGLFGGLPLLFGMTTLAGLFEAIFSRFVRRLQGLFPPDVTGLVVMMAGVAMVPLAASKFLGVETEDAIIDPLDVSVSLITLATMIGINIWGQGTLRLYCVLIGMGVGYLASYIFGILGNFEINYIRDAPFMALPDRGHISWSFNGSLLVPFLIASLASTVKTIGDLLICQKINDDAWERPDMKSISGGLLADGCGSIFSGLLGGMGISTSSSNVGVSIATGATSRQIAFAAGLIFVLFAFFPMLTSVYTIMPKPVMGAILVFCTCLIVMVGMQIIMSTKLDLRGTYVIGTSLVFGLSVDILPGLYTNIHPWLAPIFSSSLTLSTLTAITLNKVLRINQGHGQDSRKK